MTHNDIYKHFLIEYDKANITSSYPSLTDFEIVTILNKAYLALIAQKVSGNNQRRVLFEGDVKAISDLQNLINSRSMLESPNTLNYIKNAIVYNLNEVEDFLYYVNSILKVGGDAYTTKLIDHSVSEKFIQTKQNEPWIEHPVCYLEDNKLWYLVDPSIFDLAKTNNSLTLVYVKQPTYFSETTIVPSEDPEEDTYFELTDSAAEELINLAILFATETVESPRIQSKSQLMTLEA